MAYIGRQLARGENKLFDDISSSFNGSTTTFNLTVSSVATATATPYQLFVSLGGVMQKPNTDFTTAGNQITFTTAPAAGLSCWIMMQGDTIDQAAIPDASVTPSKISGSNFAFSGDLRLKDADGSHYVGFASPTTVAANKVWTLPAADGSASQYLQTNGSGVLSWATVSIGGGTGIDFNDNVKARYGTGNDLEVFHNGSNSVINDAGTGDLLLQVGGTTQATISSTGVVIANNLTVSGTTTTINTQTLDVEDKNIVVGKVSTPSDTTADGGGITLKGASDKTFNWVNATDAWTSSEHIHLIDNKKLFVGGASGTTDGLEIFHDGSTSTIKDSGTGNLNFQGSHFDFINAAGNEYIARLYNDGACELYHNNSKKVETNATGINVTGAIQVNGAALSTAPEITANASGAVTAGKTMIINSNGTTSHVSATTTIRSTPVLAKTLSTAVASGNGARWAVTYDKDNNVIIMTWKNSSGNVYAIAGTPSAGTITWGSATQVNSGSNRGPDCCYVGSGKFIIVYRNSSNQGKARMMSVSSNAITVGSEMNIGASSTTLSGYLACTYHEQQDRIYIFTRESSSGRIRFTSSAIDQSDIENWQSDWRSKTSGGSGSDGSGTYLRSDNDYLRFDFRDANGEVGNTNCVYDPDSQRVHALYCNDSENRVEVVSCDAMSSTGVNTAQTIFSNDPDNYTFGSMGYDTVTNRGVACYEHSNDLRARTFTWNSSNTNFDFGTELTVTANLHGYMNVIGTDSGAVGFIYSTTDNLTCRIGTLNTSNGDISLGTEGKLPGTGSDDNGHPVGVTYDPNQDFIYTVTKVSDAGNKFVESVSITQVNTDAEGYVGIANNSASDGNAVTIRTFGSTNDNQSGLTVGSLYYIKKDGTLSTTADTPSVVAGVALSATSILVKS